MCFSFVKLTLTSEAVRAANVDTEVVHVCQEGQGHTSLWKDMGMGIKSGLDKTCL